MTLYELQQKLGAQHASDGIPLHFGDQAGEYQAALTHAVLLDRSHETRLVLEGEDRAALLHRMSTNDLQNLAVGEGRVTLFTNANARLIDRAAVYNRGGTLLLLGEPGRSEGLQAYLRANIFYNDKVRVTDIALKTHLFSLHGPQANTVMEQLVPESKDVAPLWGLPVTLGAANFWIGRRKPLHGSHWSVLVPTEHAEAVWQMLVEQGGAIPAGSLTYNVLRIRAGYPAYGRELSSDFIPLEVGLWDDVSFRKGCYTGQEIIARMESRGRLAKTLVKLGLTAALDAPADLYHDGRRAGVLTSSVVSPLGEIFAIGVVKMSLARVGQMLTLGEMPVEVVALAGAQPAHVLSEEEH